MTNSVDGIQISMEVLLKILKGNLSPDEDDKKEAESKIEELRSKVPDEFGIHLTKCVIGNKSSTSVRKLAYDILRQYVLDLWPRRLMDPKIGWETKKTIKKLLLSGLCESDSETRNLVTDLIDTIIARSHWPEGWPNLFDTLVKYLHSEKEFAILGSLRVLRLLSKRLTATQLMDVGPVLGPVILPEMYRIFENADIFSTQIRSQAVHVFSNMVSFVIHRHDKETLVQQILEPSIVLFCSKFSEILRVRNSVETDTEIKYRMIDAINNLIRRSPESISTFLPAMLPLIWETSIECAKAYRKHIINASESSDDNGVGGYEGVPDYFKHLVLAIFELIKSSVISTTLKQTQKDSAFATPESEYLTLKNSFQPEMLQHLITFTEMTNDHLKFWTDNLGQVITDETSLMDDCRLRNFINIYHEARQTLIMIFFRSQTGTAMECYMNALCDLIQKRIQTANSMRPSSDSEVRRNRWRLHVASIQAFGIMSEICKQQLLAETLSFNVTNFFENVVLADLDDPEAHPALLNTCLRVSEPYIEHMPVYLKSKFVKSIINCVENRPTCTRVCAARVARSWIRFILDQKNDENENILRAQLPTLMNAIFNLGTQLMSVEVLIVVLESFSELASRGEEFTASVGGSICTLAIAVFLQYRSDKHIIELCQTIFSGLTQNPACCRLLQAHLVPILIATLTAEPKEVSSDVFIDLEALRILVEKSPQPLSSILIENAFPGLCRFILSSQEHNEYLLDRACTVLHSYLSFGGQLVIDYRDNDGKTGLHYILQMVDHLLNVATKNHQNFSEEHFPVFKDHLNFAEAYKIMTQLMTTGIMRGQNLDKPLKAMLSHTQRTKSLQTTAKDKQNLSTVWAQLLNTEFHTVLQFLSTAQGPDGQSALAFVISDVFCNILKSGYREDGCRTIILTALSKILEFGVSHRDSDLHRIEFHEAKEGTKTAIPICLKVSEIIVAELKAIHLEVVPGKNHSNLRRSKYFPFGKKISGIID